MLCKHEANPLENNHAEMRSQQAALQLYGNHPYADAPLKIRSAPAENSAPELWVTASVCQKSFERQLLKEINTENK